MLFHAISEGAYVKGLTIEMISGLAEQMWIPGLGGLLILAILYVIAKKT